mgnify:CR=1 FL=1
MSQRIYFEAFSPAVDGGRYPAKAIVGRACVVEVDILRDGTDLLRAVLRWRRSGDGNPMRPWRPRTSHATGTLRLRLSTQKG